MTLDVTAPLALADGAALLSRVLRLQPPPHPRRHGRQRRRRRRQPDPRPVDDHHAHPGRRGHGRPDRCAWSTSAARSCASPRRPSATRRPSARSSARLRARGIRVPLVADIHFSPAAAMEAAEHVEKVRINPGNFADSKRSPSASTPTTSTQPSSSASRSASRRWCCKCKAARRRHAHRHQPRLAVRPDHEPLRRHAARAWSSRRWSSCGSAQKHDYHDVILSMKASNPKVMIQAYRLLVARMDDDRAWTYPAPPRRHRGRRRRGRPHQERGRHRRAARRRPGRHDPRLADRRPGGRDPGRAAPRGARTRTAASAAAPILDPAPPRPRPAIRTASRAASRRRVASGPGRVGGARARCGSLPGHSHCGDVERAVALARRPPTRGARAGRARAAVDRPEQPATTSRCWRRALAARGARRRSRRVAAARGRPARRGVAQRRSRVALESRRSVHRLQRCSRRLPAHERALILETVGRRPTRSIGTPSGSSTGQPRAVAAGVRRPHARPAGRRDAVADHPRLPAAGGAPVRRRACAVRSTSSLPPTDKPYERLLAVVGRARQPALRRHRRQRRDSLAAMTPDGRPSSPSTCSRRAARASRRPSTSPARPAAARSSTSRPSPTDQERDRPPHGREDRHHGLHRQRPRRDGRRRLRLRRRRARAGQPVRRQRVRREERPPGRGRRPPDRA